MKRLTLCAVLLSSVANAQPAPQSVCVSVAWLDKVAAYQSRQPWSDVSGMMDELRVIAQRKQPCDTTPKPVPPEMQPPPRPHLEETK